MEKPICSLNGPDLTEEEVALWVQSESGQKAINEAVLQAEEHLSILSCCSRYFNF